MFYSFSVEGRCVLDGSTVRTIPATAAMQALKRKRDSARGRGWMEIYVDGDGGVGGGGWRVRTWRGWTVIPSTYRYINRF